MRLDLAPEDRLCLLLARGRLSAEDGSRVREILGGPLRWDAVLERARTHDIVQLVHHHLVRDSPRPGVPEEVASALREGYRINQLRSELLAAELARLLRLLGENDVPVIPLKGVTLAKALYGDAALRVSLDIDLLVPESEAVRARRLLVTHGFESSVPEAFFLGYQFPQCADCSLLPQGSAGLQAGILSGTAAVPPDIRSASVHAGIAGRSAAFPLDLRWRLLPYGSADTEAIRDLWAESREANYFGVLARALSPEWEFLYLAVHAASHGWQMLKSLVDIHQISTANTVDWRKARQKADRFGLDEAVECTLGACSLLLDTPPPAAFAARPLPSGVRLFPATPAPAGSWSAARFQLYAVKRRADRLRMFAAFLFAPTPAECELLPLPSSLGFVYYLLRPMRLALKWSRAGLAGLGGTPSPPAPPPQRGEERQ